MSGHVQEDYPLVGGYGENRSKWFYVGAIVFVCWNILLFSLAVAAIAKANNIKDPKEPEPYVFSQTVSVSVNSTIPVLNVVSLLPNGSVRSGAGTTIYSKTNPPPPFGVGAQNLRVARFVEQGAEDHVIVAFANTTGTYLVLGTLSLDKQVVSGWYTPVKMSFTGFFDLITLPNNHFVIAGEKAVYAGTATLKPGAMAISEIGSVDYKGAVWKDVKLTALGVSTFVLSYDTGFISVDEGTTFGAIVGSVVWDMANKVPKVTFATDVKEFKGGFPVHGLFALSETTFVVAYASIPTNSSRQLACTFVRFANGLLTLGTTALFEGAVPEYYLAAVGLDSSSGVIVFVDRNKDFALRAVVVHRSTFLVDGVHFGDSMTIEDGVADSFYTSQFKEGAVSFIDSAMVSANKVVVAWADYSNSGKLTTAILTVDQAANIHSSPLYVLGQTLTVDQLANYTVSVAGLSIDAYGQVGAVVIDRKPATDAASSGNIALVEVGPKAFGVAVQNAFAGQTTKIVVNGLVDLPHSFPTAGNLQPGHIYYGRTDGSIVAGPLAGTIDKSAPYVTLSDGSLVTVDSAVGVAVGKRQLYVLPSFN